MQLQVNNLSCHRQQKLIFANISFQLNAGEILLIEGPNGSGKSSLLRLLTGLSTPSAGTILWSTEPELHYIGHTNGIKLGLSVWENLCLSQELALTPTATALEPILAALELTQQQHTLARYLSAGQKRRLALARLLLFPKKIWLLDEPLTALDVKTQTFFLTQLEIHLANGGIAIVSSHHPLPLSNTVAKTLGLAPC